MLNGIEDQSGLINKIIIYDSIDHYNVNNVVH